MLDRFKVRVLGKSMVVMWFWDVALAACGVSGGGGFFLYVWWSEGGFEGAVGGWMDGWLL